MVRFPSLSGRVRKKIDRFGTTSIPAKNFNLMVPVLVAQSCLASHDTVHLIGGNGSTYLVLGTIRPCQGTFGTIGIGKDTHRGSGVIAINYFKVEVENVGTRAAKFHEWQVVE